MNILLVDRAFGSRQVPMLAAPLRELGHCPEILASPWPAEAYRAPGRPGSLLAKLSDRGGPGSYVSKIGFALLVLHRVRRSRPRPDVVHVEEPVAAALLLATRRSGPAVVFSTMGPLPPSAGFTGLPPAEQAKALRRAWNVGRLSGAVARRQMRFNLSRSEAVIVNSEALRESLARFFGLDPSRLDVVPTGIDTSLFQPRCGGERLREQLGLPARCPTVLTVGGISRRKGQLAALKALRRVRARLPDVQLLMVGPVLDRPYLEEIRSFARESGLSAHVHLLGAVPHERLPDIYNACDLFCLLSDAEGMPESLLEAMACGLPCIASDIPNNREAAPRGDEACFVSRDDETEVAERFVQLLTDHARRRDLGRRARDSVAVNFDWRVLAPRFLVVYERVLRGAAP